MESITNANVYRTDGEIDLAEMLEKWDKDHYMFQHDEEEEWDYEEWF